MLLGMFTSVVFLFECTLPFIKKHCKQILEQHHMDTYIFSSPKSPLI